MPRKLNATIIGARVRTARKAAGLTQSELGDRIGASRFWVAEFERGKPSAELGLALKALQALGIAVQLETRGARVGRGRPALPSDVSPAPNLGESELAAVRADTDVADAAPSSVMGWPTARPSAASRTKP